MLHNVIKSKARLRGIGEGRRVDQVNTADGEKRH